MEATEIVSQVALAVLAAILGAHFALMKTKRERLWTDRYEALRKVVMHFHTIQHHFEAAHMRSMSISTLQPVEEKLLREASSIALIEVRGALSALVLLFKPEDLEPVFKCHKALRETIISLNHATDNEHCDALEAVALAAEQAADAAADLGRRSW